jgi:hypothetical protein
LTAACAVCPCSFGFSSQPVVVGLVLFVVVVLSPLQPLWGFGMAALSRRFEFQADAFACRHASALKLRTGLVKVLTGCLCARRARVCLCLSFSLSLSLSVLCVCVMCGVS